MDETQKHDNPNPYSTANLLSKCFFWWMNPLFKLGYKRRLEVGDMYNVCPGDQSELLGSRMESEWKKELDKTKDDRGKPSFTHVLLRLFGLQYMLCGFVLFIGVVLKITQINGCIVLFIVLQIDSEAIKVVQPLLLVALIRYFTPNTTMTRTDAYMYALGVSLCAIVLTVCQHAFYFGVQQVGMKIRIACCSLLYRKALRLSNAGLRETTTGQIVNMMSNDVNRFDHVTMFLHYLWVSPLVAIAIMAILWLEIGPSSLAGFAVLLFLVPIQVWMGNLFSRFRQKSAKRTDERVCIMNEIISGMRVIKMYCWEKRFGDLVAQIRSTELKAILATMRVASVSETLETIGKFPFVFAVILAVTLVGVRIRPETVFLILPYAQRATHLFTYGCNLAVKFGSEGKVTIRRIEKFLQLDEMAGKETTPVDTSVIANKCGVDVNNITAKWDKNIDQPTLHNVTASVTAGKLLAVIGPVGSGKSSLLMSVLKELPAIEGRVSVTGKIAYISQQPWVFSASLRQNITFGNEFEKRKYEKILNYCALSKDITLMPHGDLTLIGDRGVRLSGGQRTRVCLARALYMDADIYLLDDPLSAVDASVGRHIFEKVIQGLLKNKARILVTHQLQYMRGADHLVVLKEGEMIGNGTFDNLSTSGIDFTTLLKPDKDHGNPSKNHDMITAHDHIKDAIMRLRSRMKTHRPRAMSNGVVNRRCSEISLHSVTAVHSVISLNSIEPEIEDEVAQLPEEEGRPEGTVAGGVYYQYFKAGAGFIKLVILIVLSLSAQCVFISGDWWLAYWSNLEEDRFTAIELDTQLRNDGYNITNTTIPTVDTYLNMGVFGAIIFSVFILGFLRALLFFTIAVDASQKLHDRMFSSILRAHIGLFDTSPVGRILNRFSKDIGQLDDMLPTTALQFIQYSLLILSIVVVTGVLNPWVFIAVVPLGVAFVIIRQYYLKTSRHIKRLEATTRSPVFSHLSATLQGLQTIRAFAREARFVAEFDKHQDLHSAAWFLFVTGSRWFAVRLDLICVTFVMVVSFFTVFAAESMNAGLAGLSMTYAVILTSVFQWGVRQSAEVENQMISVERILDYTDLPSEAALDILENQPPPDWPQHGVISTENVSLAYFSDSPLVLKDLSFYIKAKEKVGIVGRTGAGKSSLITMLLRLVEPIGTVIIDGVNIQSIGLHDLRNKISVIPQDPILFMGTLRTNLDPFGEHEDSMLWKSLSEVELKQVIEGLPNGLDTEVSEGGVNFSVGQRQLICLARATLRKNKILMIDEATANVDPRTDALIQQTIREKFQDCTVLTIAHRLHTVMDSDRIMVLHDGEITDFDAPQNLLQNAEGKFYEMVQQTGHAERQHLIDLAGIELEEKTCSTEYK